MTDTIYWVWLAEKNLPGRADAVRMLKHFPGGAKEIYEADDATILATSECSQSFLKRLCDKDLSGASKILEFCFMNSIRILPCSSPHYPERLQSLYNKPIVLYTRGMIEDLNERFCVSIVGTRDMSSYGKHVTFTLARQLIGYGAIIISGAAYGIDSAANSTAVFMEEPTVAVLGSGVNVPYPSKNMELIDWIGVHGMVVSEFPPNTPPIGRHFPIRNRVISGLADALIVVEAGEKSGALITAKCAADQGRAVYAVPGNIGASNSAGTNRMIRDGAKIVTCTEDIIVDFAQRFGMKKVDRIVNSEKYQRYEYNSYPTAKQENIPLSKLGKKEDVPFTVTPVKSREIKKELPDIPKPEDFTKSSDDQTARVRGERSRKPFFSRRQSDDKQPSPVALNNAERERIFAMLDDVQRQVFDLIPSGKAVTTDKIAAEGISADKVMSSLTILELYGAVEALPGGLYRKLI